MSTGSSPRSDRIGSGPYLEVDQNEIAWVTFDDPERRLNVLDERVMRGLADVVEEIGRLAAAAQVRTAVFVSGKPMGFIAGADVDEIADIDDPNQGEAGSRLGQAIFREIERLPIPTVAAVHGICLGGGTELALACRHRVASDASETKIGLPEVNLGILPAWGGTTRLPRLVGLRNALDMLLTGRPVSASRASRMGLVGEVYPSQLFREHVESFAAAASHLPPGASRKKRPWLTRMIEGPGRRLVLKTARRRVMSTTGGHYPAPLRILQVLGHGLGASLRKNLELEAQAAGELIASPVAKNLIRIFRLREAARKPPEAPVQPRKVQRMAVLGAGIMGGGIAQLAAYKGVRVRLKDINHEAVAGGLQHARDLFASAVEKCKMSAREAEQAMELVSGGIEYHGFATADLVIEAIVERMDVKRAVLRETEKRVGEDCLLATNTSSLSVDEMSEALERPENFCGLHFFNPVHRMPLVEIVRGSATSDATIATVHALSTRLGKVPVVVRDGPGFLVNRILGPYLNEAGWLISDGASIEEVDAAALDFGMPMGPLRLVDEVGIDIALHAGASLHRTLGDRLSPPLTLTALGRTERLGRKNGRGFYVYDGRKEKGVDDSIYGEMGLAIPGTGVGPGAREIRARLVLAMVNEAARVLEEGLVQGAGAVDLGMIMGAGFPPFRGGLLRFADTMGARLVRERLESLRDEFGERFEPAPAVERLDDENLTFQDAFPDPAPA